MDRYIKAFAYSFNVLFHNQYGSQWTASDDWLLTDYGPKYEEHVPFRYEVVAETWPIPCPGGEPALVNLFHEGEPPQLDGLAHHYTANLMHRMLTQSLPIPTVPIYEVQTEEQVAAVNAMAEEGRTLHPNLLDQETLRAFYTEDNTQVTAYTLMVTAVDGIMYVGNMFTDEPYRKRGLAGALLAHVHREAAVSGCREALLVPSYMARSYYQKHGYQPIRQFSVYGSS